MSEFSPLFNTNFFYSSLTTALLGKVDPDPLFSDAITPPLDKIVDLYSARKMEKLCKKNCVLVDGDGSGTRNGFEISLTRLFVISGQIFALPYLMIFQSETPEAL